MSRGSFLRKTGQKLEVKWLGATPDSIGYMHALALHACMRACVRVCGGSHAHGLAELADSGGRVEHDLGPVQGEPQPVERMVAPLQPAAPPHRRPPEAAWCAAMLRSAEHRPRARPVGPAHTHHPPAL